MIALGMLLVIVGVAAYAAGKLRGEDGRHLAGPAEVERAIRDSTD